MVLGLVSLKVTCAYNLWGYNSVFWVEYAFGSYKHTNMENVGETVRMHGITVVFTVRKCINGYQTVGRG